MSSFKGFENAITSIGNQLAITLRIPIGATGAPGTPVQSWGFAATPLTRTGVGLYTVNLADALPTATALMEYDINTIQSTVAAGDGTWGIVLTEAYNQVPASLALQMNASNTSVAAEIRNGATLLMTLTFKNTAQPF